VGLAWGNFSSTCKETASTPNRAMPVDVIFVIHPSSIHDPHHSSDKSPSRPGLSVYTTRGRVGRGVRFFSTLTYGVMPAWK
jgi:hypothetical protein